MVLFLVNELRLDVEERRDVNADGRWLVSLDAKALFLCSVQRDMAESGMTLGLGKLDSGTESSVVTVVAFVIDFTLDESCFTENRESVKGGLNVAPAVMSTSELLFRVRSEVMDFGRGQGRYLAAANFWKGCSRTGRIVIPRRGRQPLTRRELWARHA